MNATLIIQILVGLILISGFALAIFYLVIKLMGNNLSSTKIKLEESLKNKDYENIKKNYNDLKSTSGFLASINKIFSKKTANSILKDLGINQIKFAEFLYAEKRFTEAVEILESAIKNTEFEDKDYYLFINCCINSDKIDRAEQLLSDMQKVTKGFLSFIKGKENFYLLKARFNLLIKKGENDLAIATAREIFESYNDRKKEILSDLENLKELLQNDVHLLMFLGSAYVDVENYRAADEIYGRLTELVPANTDILMEHANVKKKLRQLSDAVKIYEQLRILKPKDLSILLNMEKIYKSLKEYKKLKEIYVELINNKPLESKYYVYLADLQKIEEDYESAIKTYQILIKKKGEKIEPFVFSNLADLFLMTGKLNEALRGYEKMIEIAYKKKDLALLYQVVEKIKLMLNNDPDNITILQLMLKIKALLRSDDTEYRYKIARVYYKQKDYDNAFREFQLITKSKKIEFKLKANYYLGLCWKKLNNPELAIRIFEQLLNESFNQLPKLKKDAQYELALLYEQAGRISDAKKLYEEIMLTEFNFKDIKDRLSILREQEIEKIKQRKGPETSGLSTVKGLQITRYELIEEVGRGGMGVVYKAKDTKLGRIVALKVLPDKDADDSEAKERFLREAQSAAALNNNNIISVYDVFEEGNSKYIAMEFVEGKTIREILKKEKPDGFELKEGIDLCLQILNALDYAHSNKIIHRDLKPENIMINLKGAAKIMDFGLAKRQETTTITKTGYALGTIQYMSPEQIKGENVDIRTDIYALGCLMYEIFTGRPPFVAEDMASQMFNHLNTTPSYPSKYNNKIPPELDNIIIQMLAKKPDERPDDDKIIINVLNNLKV